MIDAETWNEIDRLFASEEPSDWNLGVRKAYDAISEWRRNGDWKKGHIPESRRALTRLWPLIQWLAEGFLSPRAYRAAERDERLVKSLPGWAITHAIEWLLTGKIAGQRKGAEP